jgi:hypothetical protein
MHSQMLFQFVLFRESLIAEITAKSSNMERPMILQFEFCEEHFLTVFAAEGWCS